MGNIMKSAGREAEAEECYSEALDLDGGYAVAHYNLGALLHGQGQLGLSHSVCLSVCLSVSLSLSLSLPLLCVRLSVRPSVRLSLYLSVYG